jgi:hypothetical protein
MLPTDTLYSTLFSRQPLASYHVSSACLTALDSISSARAQQFLQFKSLTRHVDSHSTTPAQRQNGDKRRLFAAPTKKGRSRNVFIRHNFGVDRRIRGRRAVADARNHCGDAGCTDLGVIIRWQGDSSRYASFPRIRFFLRFSVPSDHVRQFFGSNRTVL